jgi:hypothetical protein
MKKLISAAVIPHKIPEKKQQAPAMITIQRIIKLLATI